MDTLNKQFKIIIHILKSNVEPNRVLKLMSDYEWSVTKSKRVDHAHSNHAYTITGVHPVAARLDFTEEYVIIH